MSDLRERVARWFASWWQPEDTEGEGWQDFTEEADAILALVRDHLTGDKEGPTDAE